MRVLLAAGISGLALVSLAACGKPASAPSAIAPSGAPAAAAATPTGGPLTLQQIPHRKPGLWRQTMAMEGTNGRPMTSQICIDANSEAQMSLAGQHMPGAKCASPQFSRNLDGSIVFTNHCDMGERGAAQTTGTITGDFNSSYTAAIDTIISGGPAPSMNGEHKMSITATWTGPCAPGQKGGDMIMPNGMTVNVLNHSMSGGPGAAGGG